MPLLQRRRDELEFLDHSARYTYIYIQYIYIYIYIYNFIYIYLHLQSTDGSAFFVSSMRRVDVEVPVFDLHNSRSAFHTSHGEEHDGSRVER